MIASEELADWDLRYRRWRVYNEAIAPGDELDLFSPTFSNTTWAEVKRLAQRLPR